MGSLKKEMLLKAGFRTRAIYANQFAIRQYS